jgi:hypothetical protein
MAEALCYSKYELHTQILITKKQKCVFNKAISLVVVMKVILLITPKYP